MLEIRNLHARIEDREILKGVNLTVPPGEVHAVMGRNGSGKSTLSYVLAGKEDYEVTEGEVLLDGVDILGMDPAERAAAGLFLAFQYPIEIPGVATMKFLKAAMNALRKARGEGELSTPDFMRAVKDAGDKATDAEKSKVENAAKALEEAIKGDDKDDIEKKIEALTEASGALAQKMYSDAGAEANADGNADADPANDGAVDAEFEEVKDDDKK